ncbi:MAG TPA: MipA/OmpV family protein [Kiritimatiellia bacterium]|nr:MipA/OmpV family protein [Kiritimatiellia bacterium]
MQKQWRMRPQRSILLILLILSLNSVSSGAPVQLNIEGAFPITGILDISFFQSLETFHQSQPAHRHHVAVTSNPMKVVLHDIPEGEYIIRVFHDLNSDGKMNSNAFGVPTETSVFYSTNAVPAGPRQARHVVNSDETRLLNISLSAPGAESRAWGLGVMTLLSSNPYRGGDQVVRVLPLITFVGENLYVIGPRAGYNLYKSRFISLNLSAEYKFAGDAFEDEKFLAGMDKRSDTLMAGVDASFRGFGKWRADANLLTDVFGRHDGQESTVSVGRNFRGNDWSITPGFGLIWRSSRYNDYYFGVRTREATVERPAYQPGASVEWFARLFARYEITADWSVLVTMRFELLSDDIRDSPIVDKKTLTSGFVGLNYAF